MKKTSDNTSKKAIIIDTSALVAGFDPFSINEEQYTTPKVTEETTQDTMSEIRFRTAIENGKVKIKNPQKTFLQQAKASASQMGDSFYLSETDLQVLALALELKTKGYSPLIATDDYSIQNVASKMNLDFASLTTLGIRRQLQWIRYCPACHKKYPANYESKQCQICGTALKRKPLKKNTAIH